MSGLHPFFPARVFPVLLSFALTLWQEGARASAVVRWLPDGTALEEAGWHSLRLGGGGGGGSSPTSGGHCEERILDGLSGGGGGMKAGDRPRVPRRGCGGRDQANRVAGEQREVLGVQEQRGGHDVGGSSRIGKDQVPSCIQ